MTEAVYDDTDQSDPLVHWLTVVSSAGIAKVAYWAEGDGVRVAEFLPDTFIRPSKTTALEAARKMINAAK